MPKPTEEAKLGGDAIFYSSTLGIILAWLYWMRHIDPGKGIKEAQEAHLIGLAFIALTFHYQIGVQILQDQCKPLLNDASVPKWVRWLEAFWRFLIGLVPIFALAFTGSRATGFGLLSFSGMLITGGVAFLIWDIGAFIAFPKLRHKIIPAKKEDLIHAFLPQDIYILLCLCGVALFSNTLSALPEPHSSVVGLVIYFPIVLGFIRLGSIALNDFERMQASDQAKEVPEVSGVQRQTHQDQQEANRRPAVPPPNNESFEAVERVSLTDVRVDAGDSNPRTPTPASLDAECDADVDQEDIRRAKR